jgi:hypothetical protein
VANLCVHHLPSYLTTTPQHHDPVTMRRREDPTPAPARHPRAASGRSSTTAAASPNGSAGQAQRTAKKEFLSHPRKQRLRCRLSVSIARQAQCGHAAMQPRSLGNAAWWGYTAEARSVDGAWSVCLRQGMRCTAGVASVSAVCGCGDGGLLRGACIGSSTWEAHGRMAVHNVGYLHMCVLGSYCLSSTSPANAGPLSTINSLTHTA